MLVVAVMVQLVSVDVLVPWAAMHHPLARCARNGSANCSDGGAYGPADYRTDNPTCDRARCRRPPSGGVLFAIVRVLVVMLVLE
jgi:hypothetical protein